MVQLSFADNNETMTYNQVVAHNLAHMGTSGTDWRALEFTMVETDKGKMPQFNFPAGYLPAPTLFSQQSNGMCCELCGHTNLKYAYYIICDRKKYILLVGSECVKHFEGKSGKQIAKEVVWEENRQFLRDAIALKTRIFEQYTKIIEKGWMSSRVFVKGSYRSDYEKLKQTIGNVLADDKQLVNKPAKKASSNAVISRWLSSKPFYNNTTSKEIVEEIMKKY